MVNESDRAKGLFCLPYFYNKLTYLTLSYNINVIDKSRNVRYNIFINKVWITLNLLYKIRQMGVMPLENIF